MNQLNAKNWEMLFRIYTVHKMFLSRGLKTYLASHSAFIQYAKVSLTSTNTSQLFFVKMSVTGTVTTFDDETRIEPILLAF